MNPLFDLADTCKSKPLETEIFIFLYPICYTEIPEYAMKTPVESYYDILSLRPDASLQEITASYRSLAKMLHPDVCESPDAEELFKAVNEAYQVLRDPKKRDEYDASLAIAKTSPYNGYYQGSRQYRDPRTWYYKNSHNSGQRRQSEKEHQQPEKRSVFPRMVQVVLFYLTLCMAIFVIAQLFLLPWIDGMNASDARSSFSKGNQWMGQEEYLKAIESYQDAATKLPSFSEAWRAKGLAEMKKADQLMRLGKPDADKYYRDAIRSFSNIAGQSPEDVAILKARAKAYLMIGEAQKAESLLNTAKKSGIWDTEMGDLLHETTVQDTRVPRSSA